MNEIALNLFAFLGALMVVAAALYGMACYINDGPPRCRECRRLCFPHQAFHERCLDRMTAPTANAARKDSE